MNYVGILLLINVYFLFRVFYLKKEKKKGGKKKSKLKNLI